MDSSPETQFDLLIRGGHVIDPANKLDAPADVGIISGRVVRVGPDLPARAAQVVDASGLYVTPGLLDIHTHVYPFRPTADSYVECLHPDASFFHSGVTTTVDAGTAGWEHWLDFKENWIDRSRVRILAFLNIARRGMVDARSEQKPEDLDPRIAGAMAAAFPEVIVGIKSAHYWTRLPWDEFHPPWASVDRAIEAASMCGMPVMVDFWPRPPERPYPDLILKHLRPGDFHTHVFAQQFPVLTPEGQVSDFLLAARERGVLFDLGHGAASFWFRNAVPAYRRGFAPDTLSTDLHMANANGPVISMLNIVNKFLNIGMPLHEAIHRSTDLPARLVGHPELGTLAPGSEADVAVFRKLEGKFSFTDCGNARLRGPHRLECVLTVRAGQIVYDPSGLSMPDWEQAPEEYWRIPELQA
jgi:dihydroorotase